MLLVIMVMMNAMKPSSKVKWAEAMFMAMIFGGNIDAAIIQVAKADSCCYAKIMPVEFFMIVFAFPFSLIMVLESTCVGRESLGGTSRVCLVCGVVMMWGHCTD